MDAGQRYIFVALVVTATSRCTPQTIELLSGELLREFYVYDIVALPNDLESTIVRGTYLNDDGHRVDEEVPLRRIARLHGNGVIPFIGERAFFERHPLEPGWVQHGRCLQLT